MGRPLMNELLSMVFQTDQERPRGDTRRSPREEARALLVQLRDAKDLPSRQELIKVVYDRLAEWLETNRGLKLGADIQTIYKAMANASSSALLVRQERLDNVVALLVEDESHELLPEAVGGKRYANAAVFGNEGDGVGIAFGEGSATKYGITALISFDPRGLHVEEIPPSECDLRDRTLCRSVSGVLESGMIKHLVVRIPRRLFPEEYLTSHEAEVESETGYIFRGVTL